MCSYVCSAPCERACRRGDIDRPLAIRAMKRFLVEWHEASGIPDVMPQITPREERVAVVGAGPAGLAVARELAMAGIQVTVFDSLPYGGGTMLIGVPAFRLPREAIEMDVRLSNRLGEPDASGRRSPVPIEGSEFVIKADTVIPAVSQAADLTFLPVEANFEIGRGRVRVDPATYATNVRGVFACGDFVTGPTTLIEAAGHGKKCAYAIDRYLTGRTDVSVAANVKITSSWRHDMPELYDVLPRQ